MDEGYLDRMMRAKDALREGELQFCTRCGSRVDPHQPCESLGHDEYWDYDERLAADAGLRQPGDRAYHCPVCQARWYAVGWQDTGYVGPCGHFLPVYVAYCGLCGARAKPAEPGAAPDPAGM
jgi:hypothetical protein